MWIECLEYLDESQTRLLANTGNHHHNTAQHVRRTTTSTIYLIYKLTVSQQYQTPVGSNDNYNKKQCLLLTL